MQLNVVLAILKIFIVSIELDCQLLKCCGTSTVTGYVYNIYLRKPSLLLDPNNIANILRSQLIRVDIKCISTATWTLVATYFVLNLSEPVSIIERLKDNLQRILHLERWKEHITIQITFLTYLQCKIQLFSLKMTYLLDSRLTSTSCLIFLRLQQQRSLLEPNFHLFLERLFNHVHSIFIVGTCLTKYYFRRE